MNQAARKIFRAAVDSLYGLPDIGVHPLAGDRARDHWQLVE